MSQAPLRYLLLSHVKELEYRGIIRSEKFVGAVVNLMFGSRAEYKIDHRSLVGEFELS